MNKQELRTMQFDSSDLTFDDKKLKVSGYVNKAGSVSQVLSGDDILFRETINPQAFIDALKKPGHPIDFYAEHDPKNLLATTVNNSLILEADETGLHMEATIVNTTIGRDTYEMIKNGIISNMSFGFVVNEERWESEIDDNVSLRIVDSLELFEVSAVRFPAYLDSSIGTRSKQEIKDLEQRGINNISDAVKLNRGVQELTKELRDYSIEELNAEIEKRSNKDKSEETKDDKKEDLEKLEEKRSDNSEVHISKEDIQAIASAVVSKINEQRAINESQKEKTSDKKRDDVDDTDVETDSACGSKKNVSKRDEEIEEPVETDSKEKESDEQPKEKRVDKNTEDEKQDVKESTDNKEDSEKRSLINELKGLFADED